MIDIRQVADLTTADRAQFGSNSLQNFLHFLPFATRITEPLLLRGERNGRLIGVAPVVRLVKRPSTAALRPELRRWLEPWLGTVSRKTTYLVDTAFLAFEYCDPFFVCQPGDLPEFRAAVVRYLQELPDADALWISTPGGDQTKAKLAGSPSFEELGCFSFDMLPSAQIHWPGLNSWEQFLASQSKKRRRNSKIDRDIFEQGGGRLELLSSPFSNSVADSMKTCLRSSEKKSHIHVPYNDVLIGNGFRTQPQIAWCAWKAERLAGFMSFIRNGPKLLQCHGGFDYSLSLPIRAYPRLIDAAIQFAMETGCDSLSLGPLNNEAKRRAATCILPMRVHLWNRRRLDAFLVRRFLARQFQVYTGP